MENPKSKSQIPNKFQGLTFQNRGFAFVLELGVWSLFGFWILDFGISRAEWKTFGAPAPRPLADANYRRKLAARSLPVPLRKL
jgi:hypothetical protein